MTQTLKAFGLPNVLFSREKLGSFSQLDIKEIKL